MPVHKCKGGYRWGSSGKIYKTKAEAEKQGRAIADLRASEDATWLTPNNVSDAYGRANQYWDAERKAAEESGATLGSWFMPSYENSQLKAMGDTSIPTGIFAALEKFDPIGYLGLIDAVRRRK